MNTEVRITTSLERKVLYEYVDGKKDYEDIKAIMTERFQRYGVNLDGFTISKIEYHEDADFTTFEFDYGYWKVESYFEPGFEVWY